MWYVFVVGRNFKYGFSVAELVLSLGFIATAILAVLGLTTALHRTGQESADRVTAATVAESEIQKVTRAGQNDPNFWDLDHPAGSEYDQGSVTIDGTKFDWEVTATTVSDGVNDLGSDGGTKANNRVKKVNIKVTWWDSDTKDTAGFGKLEFRASRLVSEVR